MLYLEYTLIRTRERGSLSQLVHWWQGFTHLCSLQLIPHRGHLGHQGRNFPTDMFDCCFNVQVVVRVVCDLLSTLVAGKLILSEREQLTHLAVLRTAGKNSTILNLIYWSGPVASNWAKLPVMFLTRAFSTEAESSGKTLEANEDGICLVTLLTEGSLLRCGNLPHRTRFPVPLHLHFNVSHQRHIWGVWFCAELSTLGAVKGSAILT